MLTPAPALCDINSRSPHEECSVPLVATRELLGVLFTAVALDIDFVVYAADKLSTWSPEACARGLD